MTATDNGKTAPTPETAPANVAPARSAALDKAALSVTGTVLSPPSLTTLPVIAVLAYLHLAAARWLGFEGTFHDLVAAMPDYRPWSTLLYYYGLSLGIYWAKPTVLELIGLQVGLSRRQIWGLRWQADNYHFLFSLVATWAILLGTEGSERLDSTAIIITTLILGTCFVVAFNISYAECWVDDEPAPAWPSIASLFDSSAAPATEEGAIRLE